MTQGGVQRHHQLFPQRVDGGVRDLGEKLLEVGVKEAWSFRQNRKRGIVPHGTNRLFGRGDHRQNNNFQFLLGITKGLLMTKQLHRLHRRTRLSLIEAKRIHAQQVVLQPLTVRFPPGDLFFDFVVLQELAASRVYCDHLTWTESPFFHDLRVRDLQDAHLRGHDDDTTPRDLVPSRPQPVTVENGAHSDPVGEGHRCRTIPRFADAGEILVGATQLRVHVRHSLIGLRDEHHHGVKDTPTREREQLQGIIEARGVASPFR